jgi:hypothetical protein
MNFNESSMSGVTVPHKQSLLLILNLCIKLGDAFIVHIAYICLFTPAKGIVFLCFKAHNKVVFSSLLFCMVDLKYGIGGGYIIGVSHQNVHHFFVLFSS